MLNKIIQELEQAKKYKIPHIEEGIEIAIQLIRSHIPPRDHQGFLTNTDVDDTMKPPQLSDEDFSFTPLLSKYQNQKPKGFGDYIERCYPISAVLDMFAEIKQYYANHRPNEWVRVEDRLPEVRQDVLVFMSYGKIDCCYYDGESWRQSLRPQHSNGDVTHWTPLPTKPQ